MSLHAAVKDYLAALDDLTANPTVEAPSTVRRLLAWVRTTHAAESGASIEWKLPAYIAMPPAPNINQPSGPTNIGVSSTPDMTGCDGDPWPSPVSAPTMELFKVISAVNNHPNATNVEALANAVRVTTRGSPTAAPAQHTFVGAGCWERALAWLNCGPDATVDTLRRVASGWLSGGIDVTQPVPSVPLISYVESLRQRVVKHATVEGAHFTPTGVTIVRKLPHGAIKWQFNPQNEAEQLELVLKCLDR